MDETFSFLNLIISFTKIELESEEKVNYNYIVDLEKDY